jgi:hypothetical protein
MTDRATRPDERDSVAEQPAGGVRTAPALPDGVATTESYEDDGAVVLYDAENPLAWVEADDAVSLSRMA